MYLLIRVKTVNGVMQDKTKIIPGGEFPGKAHIYDMKQSNKEVNYEVIILYKEGKDWIIKSI